jgi:predicted aldo/keto reductase-like oxidoreductase
MITITIKAPQYLYREDVMQYRNFGRLDFKVSALGFGAMRLPTKDGAIDETKATEMIHFAIDQGLNYIDTAYNYHRGESESFLGRALRGGYRDRVKLATKMPTWLVNDSSDFDKLLNTQLDRLQVDFVDFYLLHSLDARQWTKMRELGVREWAEKAVAAGRFGHLCFSFHGSYEEFKQIVDDYDWPMCLIQYNYMDVENQAGTKGLKYAASKGMAVAIMEPLLGGKLASAPGPVQAIWDSAPRKRSAVGWALHWLWNQPEVSVVLSGMSTMQQVKDNIEYANESGVGSLTNEELALYDRVREAYHALTAIACTQCGYCMPCPQGVDIPRNFFVYNQAVMYDSPESGREEYEWWKRAHERDSSKADIRAAGCAQCRACEAKCPQSIQISKWMPVIHKALGENGPLVKTLD